MRDRYIHNRCLQPATTLMFGTDEEVEALSDTALHEGLWVAAMQAAEHTSTFTSDKRDDARVGAQGAVTRLHAAAMRVLSVAERRGFSHGTDSPLPSTVGVASR